jgi:hypothetical protein
MLTSWKEKVYAPQPVNTGRQHELDMAKLMMLFFLPFIHCIIECTPEEGFVSGIPFLFDSVIGGPMSAPVYMFAMGVGMAYSRRASARHFARRGLLLMGIGYVLNICRFLLPFLVGYAATGDRERYLEPLFCRVLGNDILPYAGLVFLAMALFLRLKLPDLALLGIGLASSLVANFFNGCSVGSTVGNIVVGYFVGTESPLGGPWIYSDFPLLNWILIPLCGYVLGKRLRYVKNKGLFYACIAPVCGVIAVVYCGVNIVQARGMFGEGENCYYHVTTPDLLACLCVAIGLVGLHYLLSLVLPRRVLTWASRAARNINAIYCIHWVLVSWIAIVLVPIVTGETYMSVNAALALGLGISLVTIWLANVWAQRIRPRLKRENAAP